MKGYISWLFKVQNIGSIKTQMVFNLIKHKHLPFRKKLQQELLTHQELFMASREKLKAALRHQLKSWSAKKKP